MDEGHELCTICCESCAGDRETTPLPCGHVFHAACLAPWLFRRQSCPNCRCGPGGSSSSDASDSSAAENDSSDDEHMHYVDLRSMIAQRTSRRVGAINRALRMAKRPDASRRVRRTVTLYEKWRESVRVTRCDYVRENELQRGVQRVNRAETHLLCVRHRQALSTLRTQQQLSNERDASRWKDVRRRYARQLQYADKYRNLLVEIGEGMVA